MATPTVTGFKASAQLGGGKEGLDSDNASQSPVVITGTDLSSTSMTVNVSNGGGVSWAGDLTLDANQWKSTLTCKNNSVGREDSEDVTVTVTGKDGTSPGYKTSVNVGPG
jgi:hypothetical protein